MNTDDQMQMMLNQQRTMIDAQADYINRLESEAGIWEFFAAMRDAERKDLITRYDNGLELSIALALLMKRDTHTYRYPGNPEQLHEEAGHYADTYRGGGWMAIRSLLVSFHRHCVTLGI